LPLARTDIEAAYRSYGHSVLRRARRILGRDDEAQEVLQEVFASLLDAPEQFAGRSAVSSWLYGAATHRCLNRLRNQRTRRRLLDERVAPAMDQEQETSAESRGDLARLLAGLPDDQATAVIHYYIDEMSHAEIAELMGCSRRHVGNLLERSRSALERQVRT
jgi:RNA polymerase sigma factor (sigma-70 family)